MEWRLLKVTPPLAGEESHITPQGESKRFPWDFSCPTGSTVGYTAKSKTECFLQWRTLSQTNCNLYDNFLDSFARSSSLIAICKYFRLQKYTSTPKPRPLHSDGVRSVLPKLTDSHPWVCGNWFHHNEPTTWNCPISPSQRYLLGKWVTIAYFSRSGIPLGSFNFPKIISPSSQTAHLSPMENTLAARLRSSWWIARCIPHWPFFSGAKCGKMSWEDTGLTIVDFYHLPSSRQKIWALYKFRQSQLFLLEYSINFMSLRMTPLPNSIFLDFAVTIIVLRFFWIVFSFTDMVLLMAGTIRSATTWDGYNTLISFGKTSWKYIDAGICPLTVGTKNNIWILCGTQSYRIVQEWNLSSCWKYTVWVSLRVSSTCSVLAC